MQAPSPPTATDPSPLPGRVGRGSSLFGSFSRSQASAVLATGIDFGLLFSLVEFFHVWYVGATAVGAFAGAAANFLLNRHWSFNAADGRWEHQAFRYFLVSGGSLLLNSGGVYWLTDGLGFHYAVSVFLVSAVVGVGYNFPLHRYFVFK